MGFYIIFYTNVMSGLTLLCTDLRFGLPRASPPLQGPILRYFSPLLDFLLPPLCLKVQSSAISRSFWTSSCLSSASRSNPPIFLAPFGLPRASPPPQSPIHSPFSLLLDFLVPLLRFKVQSSSPSRSFWTFSCLSSASRSNPQLFLALFGLPRASPPPQGPILRYFSLLLDFRASPLHFKVQSATPSRSFWTSAHPPSTSKSNPPLFLTPFGLPPASPPLQSPILHSFSLLLDFLLPPLRLKVHSATLPLSTTQKRRIAKQSASLNPPILIHQSQSTSPILHQPIPPSKAPAISATSESGTRTYLPSGTNHFPIGLSAPALTASTANFFPATQKNIIAASIAPSGQI